MQDNSNMQKNVVMGAGSTSSITRLAADPGWVMKCPIRRDPESMGYVQQAFEAEAAILDLVTGHPRVIEYGGKIGSEFVAIPEWGIGLVVESELAYGLRLKEYANGNLEKYLQSQNDIEDIDLELRYKWCRQIVEAIVWIHSKNVLHNDLSPGNILLDDQLNLILSDFGSAYCNHLNISSTRIPDPPYRDPRYYDDGTLDIDIFALGSILYLFMTGHPPYGSAKPLATWQQIVALDDLAHFSFLKGEFPDVKDLKIGTVIQGCWQGEFESASEILSKLDMVLSGAHEALAEPPNKLFTTWCRVKQFVTSTILCGKGEEVS